MVLLNTLIKKIIDFLHLSYTYFNWWIPYHLICMYVKPRKRYSVPLSCIASLYRPLWGVTPSRWGILSLKESFLRIRWTLFVICKNRKNLKVFWTDLVLSMENNNLEIVIVCYCFQFCRDLYAACSSGNEWWGSCWKCYQDTWIWK